MPTGCSDTPWFLNRSALVLNAKSAAMKNNIVKTICLEELLKLSDCPPCGVGRPFKGNRSAGLHDNSCKFKETVYSDKGLFTHVVKTISEVNS